jgi:hypothetical protein
MYLILVCLLPVVLLIGTTVGAFVYLGIDTWASCNEAEDLAREARDQRQQPLLAQAPTWANEVDRGPYCNDGINMSFVQYEPFDSPDAVLTYYRDAATADGWTERDVDPSHCSAPWVVAWEDPEREFCTLELSFTKSTGDRWLSFELESYSYPGDSTRTGYMLYLRSHWD